MTQTCEVTEPCRRAEGRRKLNLDAHGWRAATAEFKGLPQGVTSYHALLDAFKAAAPALGVRPEAVALLDKLFGYTGPQDWQAGSRPLVWPSNLTLADDLGRELRSVQVLIADLVAAGFVVMRDSPTGKRYGERDRTGKIDLARSYGFDLSVLALRFDELKAAAQQHARLRAERAAARRRAYIAKAKLLQAIETASEAGLWCGYWDQLESDTAPLFRDLRGRTSHAELQRLAQVLEGMAADAGAMLIKWLETAPGTTNNAPVGASHDTLYTYTTDPHEFAVIQTDALLTPVEQPLRGCDWPRETKEAPQREQAAPAGDETLTLTPAEVARLAPPLAETVGTTPTWPMLLAAADAIRQQIGIPDRAWIAAFERLGAMGRLLALAELLSYGDDHFKSSRPAYFQGMVNRAARGELNLTRALYGMRQRAEAREADPRQHAANIAVPPVYNTAETAEILNAAAQDLAKRRLAALRNSEKRAR
jgi:replication initiation protein RepC